MLFSVERMNKVSVTGLVCTVFCVDFFWGGVAIFNLQIL